LPVEKQIEKLKGNGLSFNCSDSEAFHFFLTNNFYRFKGYTSFFQNESDNLFGACFEDVKELYDFDHKLRLLIFDAISQIEISFRAQVIYQYALEYGSHWHLDSKLFKEPKLKSDTQKYIDYFQDFHEVVSKEVSRSRDPFILHYKECYDSPSIPPCWMCFEVLSFGSLSKKMYSNLKDDDYNGKNCKRKIADFFGVSPVILESWLNHIAVVRNICAHHGRLWNRTLPRISKDSKYYINFQGSKNICISA
jgi:Abortive infection bacteriophage resistance protein